jgi:hypothetical protein
VDVVTLEQEELQVTQVMGATLMVHQVVVVPEAAVAAVVVRTIKVAVIEVVAE